MYLHIGSSINIKKADIVGIFELDGKITPKATKVFLNTAEREGRLVSAGFDLPKSFIVVRDRKEKKEMVYLSHIAVASLIRRCDLPL